jgi:ubiquinone/menaquinone biosynthesis C-methylase UbiE
MAGLLDHYACIHAPFLHAYGEAGTEFLLRHLNPPADARILEIGFGTGATLCKIASRFRQVNLCGVEASPVMLRKAKNRLAWIGSAARVDLRVLNADATIPFSNNAFDFVYAESVFGIRDENEINKLLEEVKRLLGAGGTLYLNETVWLDGVSPDQQRSVNAEALRRFGIRQASEYLPHKEDWRKHLAERGFGEVEVRPMESVNPRKKSFNEFICDLYSMFGKFSLLNPRKLLQHRRLHNDMDFMPPGRLMEGMLLIARL